MKKIILSFIMVSVFIFSYSSPVYAKTATIATSDFKTAMQELYSNYTDISFDMDEENNPKTMTLEQYNSIMKEAKENLDDRERQIEIDLKNGQAESADSLFGIGTRAIMPYTYASSVNTVVYGSNKIFMRCAFNIDIVATADAQYGKFMNIDSHSVYRNGISLDVSSCSVTNQYGSISSDRKKAYVGANVSIVFQYSVQGFTYQDTVNQLVAQSFSL